MYALFAAVFVAPLLLCIGLNKTRAWWLPPALLAGFAIYVFTLIDRSDDSTRGWVGLGNLVLVATGVTIVVYAAILLSVSIAVRISRRRLPEMRSIAPGDRRTRERPRSSDT